MADRNWKDKYINIRNIEKTKEELLSQSLYAPFFASNSFNKITCNKDLPIDIKIDKINQQYCTKCEAKCLKDRSQVILRTKGKACRLLLINDFPREEEDIENVVFAKERKDIVDRICNVIPLEKSEIIQTFATKCYTSEIETVEEMSKNCFDFLIDDIFNLKPEVIIAFGSIPTQRILNTSERLSRLNGSFLEHLFSDGSRKHKCWVAPLFHPEYLNINPVMKKSSWEGIQKIIKHFS